VESGSEEEDEDIRASTDIDLDDDTAHGPEQQPKKPEITTRAPPKEETRLRREVKRETIETIS
jgi:hypothetical protein